MSGYTPTLLVGGPRFIVALNALSAGLLSAAEEMRELSEESKSWPWPECPSDWQPEPLPLLPSENYTVPVYDNGLRWESPACRWPPHRQGLRPGEKARRKAKRKQQRQARRKNR